MGEEQEKLKEEAKWRILLDYENVAGVINLKVLNEVLQQNLPEGIQPKSDLENIESFKKCKEISIEYYNILRIDFLWVFPNLSRLSLANNMIEKIERLESLVKLTELNLSFNKIETIENLEVLVNLEVLNLYGNKISKIENLDALDKLKLFSIGENNIHDINCIKYLRKMKNIKSLCMSETPLEKENEHSKETVAVLMPQLVFYNYNLITEEEKSRGRALNLEMVEEIEEQDRLEEEINAEKALRTNRNNYLREALIEKFDDNDFFEHLMENDEDGNILRSVGGDTIEVFNEFQAKLRSLSEKMRTNGDQFLIERLHIVSEYEEDVENKMKAIGDDMKKIVYELWMNRRELNDELMAMLDESPNDPEKFLEGLPKRIHAIKVSFKDVVGQCWFKMMELEMKRFDIAEEMNSNYEVAVKNLAEKQTETFLNIFTEIRDTEKNFTDGLAGTMSNIVSTFHAHHGDVKKLAPDIRTIYTQPEFLNNLILASYDLHLLLINDREDAVVFKLEKWYEERIIRLAKDEFHRNRKAVYEINKYLDNQLKFFDSILEPVVSQFAEIFQLDNK